MKKASNQKASTLTAESAKNIFIAEMNKKAKKIGMEHSYFVEPAGFPSTIEQVMTTRDMLKMVIHASSNKELARIWSKKSYTMNIGGDNARELSIDTTVSAPMIEDEYEIFAGKTGAIWGTNEIDGFHMILITNAPNERKFVSAIRGASTPKTRVNDLKIALDNAKLLLNDPDATVNEIESESVAVCLMPVPNPLSSENVELPLIYSKNADVPGHPASLTKIISAITALDYLTDLDEKMILQESDITPGMGDYFHARDMITFRDALHGMMLPSSNTCATAVARITGEKISQKI
ncbi:serine hydrolase [Bacillus sp. B15-48]|uniref:serine hydrolase n=1 Tax=Bacillus sp. B15-48 TaxID=1548601 RepID=UPI00193FB18C|nr:serine hydrolase [Bacillus sp. B15-48]MBM4763597.1 hypothetical protein [Bacillus sp. B15-48]